MEFNAQIAKLVKKYSGNSYALIEITCRISCVISKIQSHSGDMLPGSE